MGMRTYRPMRLGAFTDEQTRRELQPVDDWLRQLSTQQARLTQMPIGTPTAVSNPGGSIDSSVFLYLPGRASEQKSYGPVSFDAFPITYGTGNVPTTETWFSLRSVVADGTAQPARVFLGAQSTRVGATGAPQNRYWAFPSLTEINGGPTTGIHYFVDQDDYQTLSKKTLQNDAIYSLEDTVRPAGWMNANRTKTLQHAWGGSYPVGGYASDATRTTPTGIIPSIQIPALDAKDNGAGALDRTHCLPVVKRAHTVAAGAGAPFEASGLLFGSSSGRELYPMFTSAQGTLAAPADNSFPLWHPTVTTNVTFTGLSATATMASTTGIVKGMRMRQPGTTYSLSEDTHVASVDSGTQITMSQQWLGSNSTVSVDFFGMTWSDTATAVSLAHSALTGLSADDHTQYLLLAGRATGQRIGSAAQTGNSDDIAMSGRFILGTTATYSAEQLFVVAGTLTNTSGTRQAGRITSNVTASGSTSGTYRGMLMQVSGGGSLTGGAPTVQGAFISATLSPNAAVGIVDLVGLDMQATWSPTSPLASVGALIGLRGKAIGSTNNFGDTVVQTSVNGIYCSTTGGGAKSTDVNGIRAVLDSASKSFGYTQRTIGINLDSFGDTIGTTWGSGVYAATVTNTSATLSAVTNVASIHSGQYITGTGIPAGTYVVSTNVGALTVLMSNPATANGTSVTIWGTTGQWIGISVKTSLPIGGEVVAARAIDVQSDIPSQHFGRLYLRPPTPSGWPTATAFLHIGAGAAAASSAPIKLTSGTNLTTPEAGAIEFNGTRLFVTDSTPTRQTLEYQSDTHNLLSAKHADTTAAAAVRGDIITAQSGVSWKRLALGAVGQGLMSDGTDVVWMGMPMILSTTTGIDASAVAATNLYTVPAGKKCVVTGMMVRTTAYTSGAFTADAQVTSAGDVVPAHNFNGYTAADQFHRSDPKDQEVSLVAAATNVIKFNISASTAVATVAVDLMGYLI